MPRNLTIYMKWTNFLKNTLTKLVYKETEKLNISITIREIEFAIKNIPKKENCKAKWFHWQRIPNVQDINNNNLIETFSNIKEEPLPSIFYETSIFLIPKPNQTLPIPLMNIDANILNKILVNQIHHYMKITHHYQSRFIPAWRDGLTIKNQCM